MTPGAQILILVLRAAGKILEPHTADIAEHRPFRQLRPAGRAALSRGNLFGLRLLADSGEQSVVTVRFTNAPDGILLVRKVCATNPSVTLQNAEFKIMYADGTLIGDSNGIYRTDEKGEIRIPGLKPGKSVVVTETKAPLAS